jgi:hypothetical protein
MLQRSILQPINLWSLGSSISLLDLWEEKYGLREDTTNHSLDSVSQHTQMHTHNYKSDLRTEEE